METFIRAPVRISTPLASQVYALDERMRTSRVEGNGPITVVVGNEPLGMMTSLEFELTCR
jgi:hypothetical protein